MALFSALTFKLKNGEIKIVKGFEKLEPKTKLMAGAFNSLALGEKKLKILFVTPSLDLAPNVKPNMGEEIKNVIKSARNINGISILASNLLNTYEVLKSKHIIFMKESIDALKVSALKEN